MGMIGYFAIGFVLSCLGTWLVAKYGYSMKILDTSNGRSSHVGVVPKGGGIGILWAFIYLCVVLDISKFIWVPAVIVSIISFYGDRKELPVIRRLGFQIACSLCLTLSINHCLSFLSVLLILFYSIFIIGTANIYNFMDGIDGIAGITALVAFLSLAIYLSITGHINDVTVLSYGISISVVAFLFFNLPTAKVFMGDVGSILLGFIFAGLVVAQSRGVNDFIVMISFLSLFYFDSISTMAVRLVNGETLTKPHRRHLYQLLANEMKIPHWKVSVWYGFFQLLICSGVIFFRYSPQSIIALLTGGFIIFILVSAIIRKKVIQFDENHGI